MSQAEDSIIIIINFVSFIPVHKALSYPLSGYHLYAVLVIPYKVTFATVAIVLGGH